ncbi:unnamed protein product [marine sediment metagenome]|uniref:Uncharacterized protein n=1 Tax=marine sediment metagenome TaxID=412755 RepID=X1LUM1_9ZZZZ
MVDMSDKRDEIVRQIEDLDEQILKIKEDCDSEVASLEKKSSDLKHDLFLAQQKWSKKYLKPEG